MARVPSPATPLTVALFGAGARGLQCHAALRTDPRVSVAGFFDNDPAKWGTTLDGVPVLEPTRAACDGVDAIIVASIYAKQILAQLTGLGVAAKVALSPPQLVRRLEAAMPGTGLSPAEDLQESPHARTERLMALAPPEMAALAARLDTPPPPLEAPGAAAVGEVACTICCNNYLAYATVLARSFLRHHPGGRFFICLADRRQASLAYPDDPRITVLEAESLGIADFEALAFKYDVLEFNTAVKPFLLAWLQREQGAERLLYLDPDILVLAPLTALFETLDRTPLVLTPHLTQPYADDHHPREIDILRAGTFNLGFAGIAAHPQTTALLTWWQSRLRDGCTREVDKGYFVDQKWMDLVPSFFPAHTILREPGYNAAYWNLHERAVRRSGDTFEVNGQRLYFFHFSGIDVHDLDAVSKHQSRVTLPAEGGLRDLFELYRVLLLTHGHLVHRGQHYAYGAFDNGVPVPDVVRIVYRDSHMDTVHPRPFCTAAPDSFYAWLRAPWTPGSLISNLFASLFAKANLLKPAPPRASADAELDLLLQAHVLADRHALPSALVDQRELSPPTAAPRPQTSAVLLPSPRRTLAVAGLTHTPAIIAAGFSQAVDRAARDLAQGRALGTGEPLTIVAPLPAPAPAEGASVAAWLWDETWQVGPHDAPLGEIWVPTTHALEGVALTTRVPVACVPMPVGAIGPSLASREGLALPREPLICVAIADPLTLRGDDLAATCAAFARGLETSERNTATLIIGATDAASADQGRRSLAETLGSPASIEVRSFAVPDLIQLLRLSDCYLAIRRTTALDPWLALALWHGRPAVVTDGAAAADLATVNNSYLVRTVAGSRTTPDLDHAAAQVRLALTAVDERRARGARGLTDVRASHSVAAVAAVMTRRLARLLRRGLGAAPEAHVA